MDDNEKLNHEDLASLLAQLDVDPKPTDEHFLSNPFRALGRAIHEAGRTVPPELIAEEIAFSIHAHDNQDASSWGSYFGPFMSWQAISGEPVDSPSLASITPDVMAYWRQRASTTKHPVMRARYADLLWELPKILREGKPDADMARVACDAYLECVQSGRYEHATVDIDKVKRALSIAISLGDLPRIETARDILIQLEARIALDESIGLWGFCFDSLLEPPNRKVPISEDVRNALIEQMEARLARLCSLELKHHPAGAEAAAIRLANYYRRRDQSEDVVRVLRLYGETVVRMSKTASAILATHSLEQLYEQYLAYGLRDDADELNEAIRVAGEKSLDDLKSISTSVEVPTEDVEAFFSGMLSGNAEEVLQRVAAHFTPDRDESEVQLREDAKRSPLLSMMGHTIKGDDGRTVARIGPLAEDLEGNLVAYISRNMQLHVPWLREIMRRALAGSLFSPGILLDFVLKSPLFPTKRQALIERGFTAYSAGDSIVAIHVLVPQLEQGVRQLATLVQAPIYSIRRGGGLQVRTLDDLLRDDRVGEVLGEDIRTYLRVLLTDARGWNVRNTVSHGLAHLPMLSMPVADRAVHAILVLALFRQTD